MMCGALLQMVRALVRRAPQLLVLDYYGESHNSCARAMEVGPYLGSLPSWFCAGHIDEFAQHCVLAAAHGDDGLDDDC